MISILRHSLKEKFVFRGQHTKRSQKPEARSQKPEARSQKPEANTPIRRHVPLPIADTPTRPPADTFPPNADTPIRRHVPPMPREHNYSVNVIWTGNTG